VLTILTDVSRLRLLIYIVTLNFSAGCGEFHDTDCHRVDAQSVTVIRAPSERVASIGRWVRLEGLVTTAKQPDIAGVDVDADRDLGGHPGSAEGILIRSIVRENEVDPFSQTRGAGTFYYLFDPYTGKLAVAQRN